ncbi:hypothetical protein IAE35_17140 [Pseudomonas sp. S75]|uniref:hypothetical protein n=1 Tax=unclassified Pseudomonas TaxID=196821 RepID=UPI001904E2C7|nr:MULTISPECIES: hypothetical protein [unclassified Pseudomonas]MBJ9977696.1 hypothetical protein [Pseudomonas sp. S30]MBK0155068.1 hypothetical protein [Pseudomonas sp. S75]
MSNDELRTEVLTRLRHAHPNGLGKEVLDNYRGEKAVAGMLRTLQTEGLIHDGSVIEAPGHEVDLHYPIKLTSAGVEAAKKVEA